MRSLNYCSQEHSKTIHAAYIMFAWTVQYLPGAWKELHHQVCGGETDICFEEELFHVRPEPAASVAGW